MLNIPIEVQDALREGAFRKNYKIKVNDVDPDTGERTYLYTIDNDTLVSESVKIDERMVTGKVLKFGLCEGSSLEFQYFDHPNINGKDVQVYCSVEYVDGNGDEAWYDIPMGWYTVDQCPMQWDTGIYKVTAYNKLKSKYLDSNILTEAEELISQGTPCYSGEIPVEILLSDLLQDYLVITNYEATSVSLVDPPGTGSGGSLNYRKVYKSNSHGSEDYGYMHSLNQSYYFIIDDIVITDIYELTLQVTTIIDYFYDRYRNLFNDYYIDSNHETSLWEWITSYHPTALDDICIHFRVIFEDSNNQAQVKTLIANLFSKTEDIYRTLQTNIVTFIQSSYYKGQIQFIVPTLMEYTTTTSIPSDWTSQVKEDAYEEVLADLKDINFFEAKKLDSTIGEYRLTTSSLTNIESLTLRELQSAAFEIDCQYGQLDRETDLFTGVELNQGGLYPADTLYPDNALYPSGNMEHPFPSTYSKLWTDTVGEQSFRYLIITYKGTENGQEVEKKLQRTVNADGTTDYNMSDNWLFRNLVWSDADVGTYADAMVLKMQNIRWFPFEMWCAGLPYVETGDAIEITDRQGNTHTSYVLTRTLDGIHNLQDTFINGELDIF